MRGSAGEKEMAVLIPRARGRWNGAIFRFIPLRRPITKAIELRRLRSVLRWVLGDQPGGARCPNAGVSEYLWFEPCRGAMLLYIDSIGHLALEIAKPFVSTFESKVRILDWRTIQR